MNYDEKYIIEKLAHFSLDEAISDIPGDNSKILTIYHQLQDYYRDFFYHFDSITRISAQFNSVIDDFVKESDRLGQISSFIKRGSQRQTIEIEKSMKLVNVFSEKVSSIYEKSQHIISLAYDMEQNNQVAQGSVEQLVTNQHKNDQAIRNMLGVINNLIFKTQKIGQITEMMKRVSTETLLLGLNAKVEAAHAGAYGKGFSVVAGEIQRLSEESKDAADTINNTIMSFSDEISLLEKVAQESEDLFNVQKETIAEVDGVFKKNCETINTYIDEQKDFNSSIAQIRDEEVLLTNTISGIITSVREIAATANEISSVLFDHNNSIAAVSKLDSDIAVEIDKINQKNQSIKVQKRQIEKKKIAFLFDVDHPFYYPTKTQAIKAAGIYDYDVSFFAPKTRDESIKEQADFLQKILDEKYDGLVISPINDESVYQKLNQISKAGIKIVFLNEKLKNIDHVSLIMTDGISIGAAAAKIVMGALGNRGEVIVNAWSGLKIDAIENRKNGFVQELGKYSDIVVHEYPVKSNPTKEQAEAIIHSMLQTHPKAQFLYMTNLDWGLFAADYMRKHHADIQVITVDFSEEVEKAILDGLLHYSLGQKAYMWGSAAISSIDKSIHKQSVQRIVDTGTFEVNQLNIGIYSTTNAKA